VLGAILAGIAAAGTGCHRDGGNHYHESAATAERAVLERQLSGLRGLVAAAERGALVPFSHVVAVADEGLVQDLLRGTLPFERVVAERFRVRVEQAEVQFRDGFGLVRLEGRASLAAAPAEMVSAQVTVFGALDVVELDPESGVLKGSVTIVAVDARRVGVLGVGPSDAERLVEDLARERLESFSTLASRLEIPIQLQSEVQLPAVGPAGGVRIEAATVPFRARVTDVKAFGGRLWVCIEAATGGESPGP
jgi:hypothetical protein